MHAVGEIRRRWLGFAGMGVLVMSMLAVAIPTAADNVPTAASASMPQVVHFTGNGFAAYESISFWLTAPDHSVVPLDQGQADHLGGFDVTLSLTSDGTWQVTAHGMMSRREVINRFIVGAVSTATGTTPPTLATETPVASPQVAVGQVVTVYGSGYQAGESISLWATGPDGHVRPLDGQQADNSGVLTAKVTFDTTGYWQVTAHGLTTGHESVRGFMIAAVGATPTPVPPAATTSVPATAIPVGSTGAVTNQPLPFGQPLVTPSPTDLTPSAITPTPPSVTPSVGP